MASRQAVSVGSRNVPWSEQAARTPPNSSSVNWKAPTRVTRVPYWRVSWRIVTVGDRREPVVGRRVDLDLVDLAGGPVAVAHDEELRPVPVSEAVGAVIHALELSGA